MIEREPNSGWSTRDVKRMFRTHAVGEEKKCKMERIFKDVKPTRDELEFVMNKMVELGVLTVTHTLFQAPPCVMKLCTRCEMELCTSSTKTTKPASKTWSSLPMMSKASRLRLRDIAQNKHRNKKMTHNNTVLN